MTRKKEIYCNTRECFEWVDARVSFYCTKCECNRKDEEEEAIQRILFESLSLTRIEEKKEEKKDVPNTDEMEMPLVSISSNLETSDSITRDHAISDNVSALSLIDDQGSLETIFKKSVIIPIRKGKGILKLVKK